MGIFSSAAGTVTAELTSADVAGMLTAISDAGIKVYHVQNTGDLSVLLIIRRIDFRKLRSLAERRGERLAVQRRSGIYWVAKSVLNRPVLLLGMALLLICAVYLPSRIFFVRVEGNQGVPDRRIIEQAAQCGIGFGASRRQVRSEKIKNDLLSAVPQLQWAAVNTSGCVATISVRERTASEEKESKPGVSSIVANRDGIITELTAQKGNPVCKIGQAVKAGEVLISGYTNCGLSIRATRAEGEVYAQTQHHVTTVTPLKYTQRGAVRAEEKKYGLLIGKNRINFYKDSGISDTSCDKMYLEYYLTLPGGFQLPVAITIESLIYYEHDAVMTEQDAVIPQMERYSNAYLLGQMVSGSVLDRKQTVKVLPEICILHEEYTCMEMIGRVRNEEIIGSYGKSG